MLCQCACAATKTRNTRSSNWYWRNVKRLGEKTAIIAVARKLLVYVYNIITTQVPYDNQLDVADTDRLLVIKLESAKQQVTRLNGITPGLCNPKDRAVPNKNTDEKTSSRKSKGKKKRQKSPFSSLDELYHGFAVNPCISADVQNPAHIDSSALDKSAAEKGVDRRKIPHPVDREIFQSLYGWR